MSDNNDEESSAGSVKVDGQDYQPPRTRLVELIRSTDMEVAQQVKEILRLMKEHPLECSARSGNDGIGGEDERFLLHIAVDCGAPLEVIDVLVDAWPGAVLKYFRISPTDPSLGSTSIITIAVRKKPECVPRLVGVAIQSLRFVDWDDVLDFFELHVHIEQAIEQLLREFPEFMQLSKEDAYPCPLFFAILDNAPVGVIRRLVDSYPESLTIRSYSSAHSGYIPLEEQLLCYGGGDEDQQVQPEILRLLASPKAVRMVSEDGHLPIHTYCGSDWSILSQEVLQLLINFYPDSVRIFDNYGNLPMHLVCHNEEQRSAHRETLDAIRFLANSYPAACSTPENVGHLPLHIVCQDCQEEDIRLIQLLIDLCPKSVETLDKGELLPLHLLTGSNQLHSAAIRSLIALYPEGLKVKGPSGETPFHIACRRCDSASADILRLFAQTAPEMLEPPQERRLKTPLHALIYHHDTISLECLEALTISEKAVKARDESGRTPFHLHCRDAASLDTLRFLLDKWPTLVEECDDEGLLPLHLLVVNWPSSYELDESDRRRKEEYHQALEYLLEVAPHTALTEDNRGITPFIMACSRRNAGICLSAIYTFVRLNPMRMLGLECGRQSRHCGAKRKRNLPSTGH